MAYQKRYRRRRSSGSGLSSTVGDVGKIANKFGPKGAIVTGVTGFAFFYWVVPALMHAWVEHNKAKMAGPTASAMGKFLDDVFFRRLIHPSEWAGIAILALCLGVAGWKAFTRTDLKREHQRDAGVLAKLVARFLD